jgi:xanthine dehydrogenase YagS FAD-binding subunit
LRPDGRRVVAARVALGGVAPIPWRVEAAERALIGAEIDEAAIARAAEAALADARPLAHNAYKAPLAKALIRRALTDLAGGADAPSTR